MTFTDKYVKKEVKEVTFFIIFGILMSIVLPLGIGFAGGAFEENFSRTNTVPIQTGTLLGSFIVYYIIIIAALLGFATLKIREIFVQNPNEDITAQKVADPLSNAVMHDPERDGFLYQLFKWSGLKKNPMRWSNSMLRMFVVFTLVFGTVGVLQTIFPQTFQSIGVPAIKFQITKTALVIFSAEPAAFSETCLMIFLYSLLLGLQSYIISKYKLPQQLYWFFGFLMCFLIGFAWMAWHFMVYGNSEVSLFTTFIFGFLGSMLTLLFGSWIPWYVWHFMNNFFVGLRTYVGTNEDIVFISIISLVVLLVAWIAIEIYLGTRRRSRMAYGMPN